MKITNVLPMLLFFLMFSSCNESARRVTNPEDYNVYLETKVNTSEVSAKKEFAFWEEKLEKAPNQFPYLGKMASANSQLFGATGAIQYLIEAENNLKAANKKTNYNNASYLRALARNYISQHRFKEALELLKKAEANGENLENTQKMLFDVYLELGNYAQAESYLKEFKSFSDFDYLIRLSKWSDHQGNLDAAIKYMEKATTIAESSNINSLKQWSYTNLADFYGHANRIQESYDHYLKALELDPNDAYAKKGISWIVYSYERNPEEALRILDSITKQHKSPD
ncbi:MAG: cell surface protein, partial [Maribacter sp.]